MGEMNYRFLEQGDYWFDTSDGTRMTYKPMGAYWERGEELQSSPARHYINSDTMDLTWHPATGEHIDSKSKFRQRTKEAGCIEIGTESLKSKQRTPPRRPGADIARAIEQLMSR